MPFNSFPFFLFFAILLLLYYFFSHKKQNLLLLVAGYIFYAAWDYRFLSLILISTTVDYFVGINIPRADNPSRKKILLLISIGGNLGILVFFKYFNFFVSGAVDLLSIFGLHIPAPTLNILLPIGISFYTFKTLSYTIDVYREQIEPCKRFLDYALFLSFFPQLLAGPIERASSLLPQITNPRSIDKNKIIQGLWLMLWGFFKKMVIADNLAIYVNSVFNPGNTSTGFQVLLAIYAFTFQIYCDFSGYTDIARGVAKLLGFETILNFNLPYLSPNPVEFWKRWHITLSTWLRDYLFLPIAYATMRHIKKPALNLKIENWGYIIGIFVTMLLGGLWHGANWTFVLWGAYHGLLLAVHHVLTRRKKRKRAKHSPTHSIKKAVKIVAFFHLTCLGWLFFRANNFHQIGEFLHKIIFDFSLPPFIGETLYPILLYIPILWIFELWIRNNDDPRTRPGWNIALGPIAVSFLILALIIFSSSGQGFIYAQF